MLIAVGPGETETAEACRCADLLRAADRHPVKALVFARTASMATPAAEDCMAQQVSACLHEATRLNFMVALTLTLAGCAGRGGKVLSHLLSSVDERDVDVVLVQALDRLSRSSEDMLAIAEALKERGVVLVVADDQLGIMP